MKKIVFSVSLLMLLCCSVSAQISSLESLSTLSWLEGKWERILNNPNQTGFEEWVRSDSSLKGLGMTIQEEDTVFKEKLSIEAKDGDWYYVADVDPNVDPTFFKVTDISESGFVSENPDHDFPKKIEYKLSGADELEVIISGDGRSVPFVFRKQVK